MFGFVAAIAKLGKWPIVVGAAMLLVAVFAWMARDIDSLNKTCASLALQRDKVIAVNQSQEASILGLQDELCRHEQAIAQKDKVIYELNQKFMANLKALEQSSLHDKEYQIWAAGPLPAVACKLLGLAATSGGANQTDTPDPATKPDDRLPKPDTGRG